MTHTQLIAVLGIVAGMLLSFSNHAIYDLTPVQSVKVTYMCFMQQARPQRIVSFVTVITVWALWFVKAVQPWLLACFVITIVLQGAHILLLNFGHGTGKIGRTAQFLREVRNFKAAFMHELIETD